VTVQSDADESPYILELSGTGIGPLIQLSDGALAFEGIIVGGSSSPQTIALTNAGNAPLALSGIATTGDFSQENDCAADLPAGGGCTIRVTFAPSAAGPRSGSLSVTNHLPDESEFVSLFGMGQDFSFSASPGATAIAAGETATFALALEAAGGFNKTLTLGCSGAPRSASCVVSPSSVTLDGASSAPATVTLQTTARTQAGPESRTRPPGPFPLRGLLPILIGILALLCAVLSAEVAGGRFQAARVGLVAGMFTALLWTACGGSGATPVSAPRPPEGTPAGTYTLTVTGTSSSLVHSITLTVTIK
jgi:hypothetical protein